MEKRRHIVAIINPVPGTGSKDKIPRLIDTVVDHERNDVSIVISEYAGHAREIAAQAVSDGADVVVAIGGDAPFPIEEGAPLVFFAMTRPHKPTWHYRASLKPR